MRFEDEKRRPHLNHRSKATESSKSADSEPKSSTIKRKASVSKGKTTTKSVNAKKIKTESETAKFDNHITDVRPSPSRTNCRGGPFPLDSDSEMSSQYSDDIEPPCCVCNKKNRRTLYTSLLGLYLQKGLNASNANIGLILNYVARHVYCVEVNHSFVPIVKSEFTVNIAKSA
jgi:hypothetical protein